MDADAMADQVPVVALCRCSLRQAREPRDGHGQATTILKEHHEDGVVGPDAQGARGELRTPCGVMCRSGHARPAPCGHAALSRWLPSLAPLAEPHLRVAVARLDVHVRRLIPLVAPEEEAEA